NGAFDLVIVDGRVRAACARLALPKVREGGWLLLDDSEREKYRDISRDLHSFTRLDFRGLNPYSLDISQTTVWQIGERR
ncbi:hypothetical protein HZA57_03600, partial [Candidatus Poribacteria bacterium]|nr:hypothetical protein [Candidatus Poribacteria bacterium]